MASRTTAIEVKRRTEIAICEGLPNQEHNQYIRLHVVPIATKQEEKFSPTPLKRPPAHRTIIDIAARPITRAVLKKLDTSKRSMPARVANEKSRIRSAANAKANNKLA